MKGQKKRMQRFVLGCAAAAAWALPGMAQESATKVAIINIQVAIAQSNDGQQAAREIQARFAPKQQELTKAQQEITELQNQLRNQEKTLSDDARQRLLRTIDEKTRAFNRSNEDATNEFQNAEQDAINEIGQKMMNVLSEYAKKNNYSIVFDVSSPQTPVLYANPATDITRDIIELYNQATAKPAASAPATPATPAASTTPASEPAAAPPAATP